MLGNLERKTSYENSRFSVPSSPHCVMHYARKLAISLHRIGVYPYRRPRELFFHSRDCEINADLLVKS